VAIAGPLSNLALAALCGLAVSLYVNGTLSLSLTAADFIFLAMQLNVLLFVLNLVPIPPLDGFSVLGGFLSARQMYSLAPLQQWGPLVLLLLFFGNAQLHVLDHTIFPAMNSIDQILCRNCLQ
jgi:Zn-dependent protease